MIVKGYINIYPETELEAKGTYQNYGDNISVRSGNAAFATRELADKFALPTRLAVAEFSYERPVYKNVYKGSPCELVVGESITLGDGSYCSEEEAREPLEAYPDWKPYHIGVVKLND